MAVITYIHYSELKSVLVQIISIIHFPCWQILKYRGHKTGLRGIMLKQREYSVALAEDLLRLERISAGSGHSSLVWFGNPQLVQCKFFITYPGASYATLPYVSTLGWNWGRGAGKVGIWYMISPCIIPLTGPDPFVRKGGIPGLIRPLETGIKPGNLQNKTVYMHRECMWYTSHTSNGSCWNDAEKF